METAAAPQTFPAIYVTIGRDQTPRFHHFWRGRLWPITRAVAEASFKAGATVYRKRPGTSLWAEDSCAVVESGTEGTTMTDEYKSARVEFDGFRSAINQRRSHTEVRMRFERCIRRLEALHGADADAFDRQLTELQGAAITAGLLFEADIVFLGRPLA